MKRFAILGSGNAGATIAAHLKLMGHEVSLYDAFPVAVRAIQQNQNTIVLEGNLPQTGKPRSMSSRCGWKKPSAEPT